MKLLREYVRGLLAEAKSSRDEGLLSEVPLADFGYDDYDYPEYETAIEDPRREPSVGYEQSQDPAYKDEVVKFFDKTKDPWYIIFLKTTLRLPKKFEKIDEDDESGIFRRIKRMQKDKSWDPNGKYIVVSFPSFSGDMSSPDWQIVHDVIGHTIEEYHRKSYGSWHKLVYSPGFQRALNTVHEALPKEMRISTKNEKDRGPDVFAAIFLGKAPAMEKLPKDGQHVLKVFQGVVDDFKDEIKEGEFWSFGGWG